MIVWGGYDSAIPGLATTGGCYNPIGDTWTPTSNTGTPTGREQLAFMWTGSNLFVWGGYGGSPLVYFDDGGEYDPVLDSWIATGTLIPGRRAPAFVWTGQDVFVWGGDSGVAFTPLDTGGLFRP